MKHFSNDREVWEGEFEFRKLIGEDYNLEKYRVEKPGLWRINAAGKSIYNIKAWMNLHPDVSKKTG